MLENLGINQIEFCNAYYGTVEQDTVFSIKFTKKFTTVPIILASLKYDIEKFHINNFYAHYQIRNVTLAGFDIYFNGVSTSFSPNLFWVAIS